MTVIMVDGTAENVPAIKASRWHAHPAQAYVTGGWPVEWSEAQIQAFPRHIRTAQQPDAGIDDGTNAREQDVEQYAATAADWPLFYGTRRDKDRATCYCSLITVPKVILACDQAGVPLPPRWRLAWWRNNRPGVPLHDWDVPPAPTIAEVLAELDRLTGVKLDPATLWACQFAMYARWDLSVVYGAPDFARN